MVHLTPRRHPEQQLLLAACTTRTAPAPHLSRRRDRDRPVGFADVATIPDPEWSRSGHNVSRFSVGGLVPGGQAALASVPLPTRVLDDLDVVTTDVAATLAARPELLHDHAVLMALAPLAGQLKAAEASAWPPVAYDMARSVAVSDQLAQRPEWPQYDARDFDGYYAVAEHENAIASIQMDIYADRAAQLKGSVA